MADPTKILTTLRRAAILFRATPGRKGSVIHPADAEDVFVAGDLHGHLATLRQILHEADLAGHPRRHLVLQELIHGPFSYPDEGGDTSHRMLDVVAALKAQFPDRLHVILGNHELSELTGRPIAKDGVYLNVLFRQGIETAYGPAAGEIYAAYRELFTALPLAVRTANRVFVCHTLPNEADLDRLDLGLLAGGRWTPESMARGGTVYALTWGRDTSAETVDRFAQLVDVDLFVTGHQPCPEGFLRANHRQLIIDGTDPHPTCLLFPARGPVTIDTLVDGVRPLPIPRLDD